MKTGKSLGCDASIMVDALKYGGEPMAEVLHLVCDAVFVCRIPPSQWMANIIVPLPKKGNLYEMTNYRGITLLSIVAKVYNQILLNRIRPFVDPVLRCNMGGFRTRRSCAEQIFILRCLMEGAMTNNFQCSPPLLTSRRPSTPSTGRQCLRS